LQSLAAEKTYNDLTVSLSTAIEKRNEWFEGVHSCKANSTLFEVMDKIVKLEVIFQKQLIIIKRPFRLQQKSFYY